jgi:ferric-dicitrate binding protein FerR (iron transport regulator)
VSNRRLAIVAGLGIVELWIVGLMIRSVCGGHDPDFSASAAHPPYGTANAGRTAQTLETGSAPHVVIDDEDATLTVSARAGTTVAVHEDRQLRGWFHGTDLPVRIERTADGVRIARADGGVSVAFGSEREQLEVVVPPDASVDVTAAGSTTVKGLRAAINLHTDDGSVAISDQRGSVQVKTDNGRIELHDVEAPAVDVGSDNGRVTFDRVTADRVAITTDNGRIDVSRSLLRGGKIQTDSGRIRLALDPRSNVTINATASSGRIDAQAPLSAVAGGNGSSDDDGAQSTIRVGNGSGRLEVGSDDGSISVLAEEG